MQKVAEVTEDQIQDWKKRFRRVKKITVRKQGGEELEFIIVRPTTAVMDSIAKYDKEEKPSKIREVIKNSCVMAGPESELEDDEVRTAVYNKVSEMIDQLQVEEKEL